MTAHKTHAIQIEHGEWVDLIERQPTPTNISIRNGKKTTFMAQSSGWLGKDASLVQWGDGPLPVERLAMFTCEDAAVVALSIQHWWRELKDMPQDVHACAYRVTHEAESGDLDHHQL